MAKMAKPFTVLLDMDSTVYDLWDPWLEWYNRHYKDTLQLNCIDRWNWDELAKPECGSKVYSFLHKKGMFSSLNMFPHAAENIRKVHNWGIKQVFCSTIVGQTGAAEKLEAIKRDFPYLGKESLVLVGHDKSLVRGDVLVDDGPHNLEAFKQDGRLTVLADMHGAPYCKFKEADIIMTNWRQYPSIIMDLMNYRSNQGERIG
jgi:5'(3')-deoxyribonucleotidase